MKTSIRLNLLSVSVCLGVADAVVQLEFARQAGSLAELAGRDSASASIVKSDFLWVVNATVGTPGQQVSLLISPSVADTWVPDATSSYCDESYYSNLYDDEDDVNPTYCRWGSFNTSQSSTFLDANQKSQYFSSDSPDGIYSSGSNGTDTLKVGGVELEKYPIGVVDRTSQWIGVLGLGQNRSYDGYNNFPDRLLQSGKINTKAYSISLDDPDGGSGSVLFGAIDTSRYEGELVRISGYASYAYYYSFGVEVTGFNGSSSAAGDSEELAWNELPFDATIGPGETFSFLPYSIAAKMWDMSGATYNGSVGASVIPCDAASGTDDDGARFTIQLIGSGGPILEVHLSDLIIPAAVTMGTSYWYYLEDSPDLCLFGVQNVTSNGEYSQYSSYYNLGSSLLRRSYIVYDIVNEEVALAPAKFTGRGDPTIVEFASYGAPAPSATRYCGESPDDGYSYNCDPHSSTPPGGSGSGSGSGGGRSYNTNSTASRNGAIGVGVAFGLVALIGLVAAIMAWKRVCCGPRDKPGKELESATDAENIPATGTTAATVAGAERRRDSLVGSRQPLSTIPESDMAEVDNRYVLPPLPPRSVSPPSPNQGNVTTDPAAEQAQPPSPEEGASETREVSEQGGPSTMVHNTEQLEASAQAKDNGKGKAVDTGDN